MTIEADFRYLARMTRLMRIRQKEYYKKPIRGKLIASKQQEKLVDELLAQHNGELTLWTDDPTDVESETHA